MKFTEYAGCVVTGTCFHNSGDEEDSIEMRDTSDESIEEYSDEF